MQAVQSKRTNALMFNSACLIDMLYRPQRVTARLLHHAPEGRQKREFRGGSTLTGESVCTQQTFDHRHTDHRTDALLLKRIETTCEAN